jgi:tRNA-specific 2-thiouridylase
MSDKDPSATRVVVAMSGGVDSSVAAALLKMQGYEVIGINLQVWDYRQNGQNQMSCETDSGNSKKSEFNSCCSPIDVNDARKVADLLEIPFYVINAEDDFRKHVVDYFIEEYQNGRTPNPCVMCNEKIKFDLLLKRSKEIGADYLATGHYAKVLYDRQNECYELHQATDIQKDQTYYLFSLTQGQLKYLKMPLGDMKKDHARKIASKFGLPTAFKKDSFEICFVGNRSYKDFLEEHIPAGFRSPGPILNDEGEKLGEHEGLYKFTIGQRKGLQLQALEPHYVVRMEPATSSLIVGKEDALFRDRALVTRVNWVGQVDLSRPVSCEVKIRSRQTPTQATVIPKPGQQAEIIFPKMQRAITPGQACVFYQDSRVIGGGWIEAPLQKEMDESKERFKESGEVLARREIS